MIRLDKAYLLMKPKLNLLKSQKNLLVFKTLMKIESLRSSL